MKVIIAGCGQMGIAAAYQMLQYEDVSHLLLIDSNIKSLQKAASLLTSLQSYKQVLTQEIDFNDFLSICQRVKQYDLILAALPWPATLLAIKAALAVAKPLVSITRPDYRLVDEIHNKAVQAGTLITLGCGFEPGLTEIFANHAAEQFDRINELHIRCGGLPKTPKPPLYYKMTFGNTLPIDFRNAYYIQSGQLMQASRFSGIESVYVDKVGILEAWHDGLLPWLIELPKLKDVQYCTQKTLRWPGFAKKITMLAELGFLSEDPIIADGTKIIPRKIVDVILGQKTRFEVTDRDFAVLQVDALGIQRGKKTSYKIRLFDNFDEKAKFSSMSRVTGFTLSIVGHMIGNREIIGNGLLRPENMITNSRFQNLVSELRKRDIQIDFIRG